MIKPSDILEAHHQEPQTLHEHVDSEDVHNNQLEIEKKDSEDQPQSDSPSTELEQQYTLIHFRHGDPENPQNWSWKKKSFVVFLGVIMVLNSTIGSSIASGIVEEISDAFDNTNEAQLVLPISIYLVGYVLGPLAFGPLSENYGRKWVMICTFVIFTVFTLGCALAPSFAALIVFRFFVGIGASSPISVVGGIYADVYDNPVTRGRALTIFMTATTFGPLCGPIISGFAGSALGWRWVYWLALILAGITWPVLLFSPETYGPVILARRAARLRKQTSNPHIRAPIELEGQGLKQLLTVVLTRPLRMIVFEAIVLCSCLYLALAYAIFYMFFEAFPIIFVQGPYRFNYGEEGLTFLPIGIGSVIACCIYLYWDHIIENAKKRDAPWARKEEYRRLPLACLGGPLFVIALFWIGWTARPEVPWIVPTLAALPFGMGFLLLFMALLNYLVDAYEIFAASATAAAACSRSLFGAILPFAARPMYQKLGIAWACSLLGFLSLLMCAIPFIFIKYGDQIRERSKFCQQLKRQKIEMQERESREREEDEKADGELKSESPEKMA